MSQYSKKYPTIFEECKPDEIGKTMSALRDLHYAMQKLLEVCPKEVWDEVEVMDTNYPFHLSFDDLASDVRDWVTTVNDELSVIRYDMTFNYQTENKEEK